MRCLASPFFDATLNSGMKEGDDSTIYLEDKDPVEWELVSPFFDIFSEAKVTEENVEILIRWFHFLGVSQMMKRCDSIFLTMIPSKMSCIEYLLDMCDMSFKFDLPQSIDQALKQLCDFSTGVF
jgi:hypothetical protein